MKNVHTQKKGDVNEEEKSDAVKSGKQNEEEKKTVYGNMMFIVKHNSLTHSFNSM